MNSRTVKHQTTIFLPARLSARRARFILAGVAPEPRTPITSGAKPIFACQIPGQARTHCEHILSNGIDAIMAIAKENDRALAP